MNLDSAEELTSRAPVWTNLVDLALSQASLTSGDCPQGTKTYAYMLCICMLVLTFFTTHVVFPPNSTTKTTFLRVLVNNSVLSNITLEQPV